MIKYLLLIHLVLPFTFAKSPRHDPLSGQWGNEVGNGGDAVVCRGVSGNLLSVEFYDVYEARVLREIEPSWELPTMAERINLVLGRIGVMAPRRALQYRNTSSSFLQESKCLRNVELANIADSDHLVVKKGCKIEQIVIQWNPKFIEDPRYVVDEELWELMDEGSKAALILHETIYREAFQHGHSNSIAVRYFNSLAISDKLSSYSGDRYIELMRLLKLPPDYSEAVAKTNARGSSHFLLGRFFPGLFPEAKRDLLGQCRP